ncbi:isoprenoid synthase domain-containing protein [Mycena vulgaris]|nr:isoprenoid synthase domain-containing protein [Mycena vulgaris]
MAVSSFKVPDLHERWPFPAHHNQWAAITAAESAAWIESFSILSPRRLKQFSAAQFGLLVSMTYPHLSQARHRIVSDLINLLFLVDDVTDAMSAQDVTRIAAVSMDALRNPEQPRPQGEHLVGEMHRNFSERFHGLATVTAQTRFMPTYELYLEAVIAEATDRDHKVIRASFESYLTLRRDTGAVKVAFALLLVPFQIPGDILNDCRVTRLEILGLDLVSVANDILSFNVEQARDDTHNAVVVVMHERGLSLQGAMDFLGAWYQRTARDFWAAIVELPPCSDMAVRDQLKMYVAGMVDWVTGNYEWSLRSGRYSPGGENPAEKGWIVPLLQKEKAGGDLV